MSSLPLRAALLALALTVVAAMPAGAHAHKAKQRLVVRGEATAVAGPCGAAGCRVDLTGGAFQGAPVGSGAYRGTLHVAVAEAFPNGAGGICAPLDGRIVLGTGTPDRLVVDVAGDSCQSGDGFAGLARFSIVRGSGRYAGAAGSGLASLDEDAAHRHRIALVGRIRSGS